MSPDLLDDLRAADPAHEHPVPPDPEWNAMASRITATPQRSRRRRAALVLAPALGVAAVVGAVATVALQPSEEAEVTPRPAQEAPAAPAATTPIYHYVVEFRELEGPHRRPVADAHSTREGWIDPVTGEIHEIGPGMEWATDGRTRRTRSSGPAPAPPIAEEPGPAPGSDEDGVREHPEPPVEGEPDGTLVDALTRHNRIGPLRNEGVTTLDGRRVRRYVAEDRRGTFRQTFFVDAETGFPVLFRTETGDYLRDGGPIPDGQRVMEDRFETFERLPDGTDRAVLDLKPE